MTADDFIAHRGWQRRYPENSLIGIEQAIQAGARHIEIDVLMTADQQLVLSHDQQLQRLCGVDGQLNLLTLDQLKDYSPCEPARLGEQFRGLEFATLRQCIALIQQYPEVHLYVEIKRSGLRAFSIATIASAVMETVQVAAGQCSIISFDVDVLWHLKQAGWPRVGPVLLNWSQLGGEELKELAPSIVFADDDFIQSPEQLAELPYPIAVYEVDRIERAQWLKQHGITRIETFAIGEMLAALGD